MGNPHVLAIPYPAQGHVIPLMEVSLWLVKNGIKVTFVNTDFNHNRVVKALSNSDNIQELLNMVSIPDGLESWDDRNELGKLTESIFNVMPGELEALITTMNRLGKHEVSCVIADENMGWALEVADKMGIRRAAFWPAAAAMLGLGFRIPKLLDEGIVDSNGRPLKNQMIQLSPKMPSMNSMDLAWTSIGDPATQKIVFDVFVKNNKSVKLVEWIICNSSEVLEPGAFSLFPNIVPIGPLLASNRLGKSSGYFWPEDTACVDWLDQQPTNSVIYIAFGSFTVFDRTQFQELALGLELTNRPFLWVVRPDITDDTDKAFPKGFKDRVRSRGKTVGWAPQQRVLSHPSIACFISHCGWNSTTEGMSNGIPFLCWPYFADQFLNESYICEDWKVGLRFKKDENGIIRQEEIKNKIEQILEDKGYKERALNLQNKTMDSVRGGCSYKNFINFIEWIKDEKK
ncbi:UDP-glycosyltransferase 83A1 [Forsythia ovata]|uniref:UDP-glycosyltransferase 83A1 n=1 Tax=Forsythia ovata TaxID=205694 RepID=A0ABD1WVC8_9LAMI